MSLRTLSFIVALLLSSAASLAAHDPSEVAGCLKISLERISSPVARLYDSIPKDPDIPVAGLKLKTEVHGNEYSTTVTKDGESFTGTIHRSIDAKKRSIVFANARLVDEHVAEAVLPSFLDVSGVVPLVPGRGVPTQAFLTLHQMKLAGIPYGGLRRAETGVIGNVETILELRKSEPVKRWLKENPRRNPPIRILEEAIGDTSSVRYIDTVLAQSGHRITKIEVVSPVYLKLSDFTYSHQRTHPQLRKLFEVDELVPDGAAKLVGGPKDLVLNQIEWLKYFRDYEASLEAKVKAGQVTQRKLERILLRGSAKTTEKEVNGALALAMLTHLRSPRISATLLGGDPVAITEALENLWINPSMAFHSVGLDQLIASSFVKDRRSTELLRSYLPVSTGISPSIPRGVGQKQLPDSEIVPAYFKIKFVIEPLKKD